MIILRMLPWSIIIIDGHSSNAAQQFMNITKNEKEKNKLDHMVHSTNVAQQFRNITIFILFFLKKKTKYF